MDILEDAPSIKTIGEIWKEGRKWKIQMPRGINTATSKVEAEMWSAHVLWRTAIGWTATLEGEKAYRMAHAAFLSHQDAVHNRRRYG